VPFPLLADPGKGREGGGGALWAQAWADVHFLTRQGLWWLHTMRSFSSWWTLATWSPVWGRDLGSGPNAAFLLCFSWAPRVQASIARPGGPLGSHGIWYFFSFPDDKALLSGLGTHCHTFYVTNVISVCLSICLCILQH
jgi:hypothetical protein